MGVVPWEFTEKQLNMGKGQNDGFSEEQLQMYKDCFKLMDINKDGVLDKNDLRGAFDNVGVLMTESELDGLLGEISGPCTYDNMLLLTAVRGTTTLESVQEIEILYTTLVNGLNKDQSETMRQLFLDTVVMTGTPHSVEFFEKMVREGKATTHEINSFFMFLPRYIMTPTQQVLKRLFKLVTEVESIKTVPTTYSLAMTGLTQLVHSACIAEDRKTSCPVNVFGEFCTPESKIVQEVLIPHLARALHQTPTTVLEENIRNIHIMSLGLLRHKNVITELTPMIESRGQVDLSTVEGARNSVSRVLAVYSLMNAGFQHPD